MTTVALEREQYINIIQTIRNGKISSMRPNDRIATALVVEAMLGVRISDIVRAESRKKDKATGETKIITTPGLRMSDIVHDGKHWRLNIKEQKTGKSRTFTVQDADYSYLAAYAKRNNIGNDDELFPFTVRAVQKCLKAVCEVLGYTNVSTHSFRKMFAVTIYEENGHDAELVRELLQHSSLATTQRYIKRSREHVEKALANYSARV